MDTSVAEFGNALEAELKNIEGKNKTEISVKSNRLISKWLDMPMQYRDPVKSGHVQLPNKGGS